MLNVIIIVSLAATLLFALAVGGRAERIGVAIIVLNMIVGWAGRGIDAPVHLFWGLDVVTALAFGVLAVTHPERLWPGVAGVAMTFVMVFSATRAIGYPLSVSAYQAAMNLSGLLVQVSLLAGAWRHRWGRKPSPEQCALA